MVKKEKQPNAKANQPFIPNNNIRIKSISISIMNKENKKFKSLIIKKLKLRAKPSKKQSTHCFCKIPSF